MGGVDAKVVDFDPMAQVGKAGHERGVRGEGPRRRAPGVVENNALHGELVDARADRKVGRIGGPVPVNSQAILAEGVDADEDDIEIPGRGLAASCQQKTQETQVELQG